MVFFESSDDETKDYTCMSHAHFQKSDRNYAKIYQENSGSIS